MRRRSTFFYSGQLDFDPRQITVSKTSVGIQAFKGAREERLTFGFEELPQELWQLLRLSHELHIRWQSQAPYIASVPLVSRISPGLHLFYTPLKDSPVDLFCPLLHKIFSVELKCHSPNATFSRPLLLSTRFASTSSFQYHSILPSLSELVVYIQRKICSHSDQICIHTASLLNIADSLDIDYDSISHTLTFSAFWSKPPTFLYDPILDSTVSGVWTVKVHATKDQKVEVGILHDSRPADRHDIQLGGYLTVVGEDDRPKPTLFQFPSRHHPLPKEQEQVQAFTVSFDRPTGLHPTMRISFPDAAALVPPTSKPEDSVCTLHTYITLPSVLFADQYQLSTTDSLFLSSHNLAALHSISGATDLEAPDYVTEKWGSNLLLELALPNASQRSSPRRRWDVTVPLHLRYLTPTVGGQSRVSAPWPVVFWACTAEEGTKFSVNPFDRVHLGYDGLFGPRTMFYHLVPSPASTDMSTMMETLNVPVLDLGSTSKSSVEITTVITILIGFLWVTWKLWPGLMRTFVPMTKTTYRKKQQ